MDVFSVVHLPLVIFFRYDYIAVYDLLDNQVGQRYCGSITSPIVKDVKGNVAVVVFSSDSANSKKGFILTYEARQCLTSSEVDNWNTALVWGWRQETCIFVSPSIQSYPETTLTADTR